MAKKKAVKTYTTSTGAQQYGSSEDIEKHADIAFEKFLKDPTPKALEILERLNAASSGARAKEARDRGGNFGEKSAKLYDKLEKASKSAADSNELKKLKKKAQTLGRLIAGGLTRAAAQGTAQETQEGVREVERQVTSVMDSSGLSDQISRLQQQIPIPNNSSGLAQAQPVAAPVPTQAPQPAGLATLRQEAARNPGIARTLGIEGATAGLLNR